MIFMLGMNYRNFVKLFPRDRIQVFRDMNFLKCDIKKLIAPTQEYISENYCDQKIPKTFAYKLIKFGEGTRLVRP